MSPYRPKRRRPEQEFLPENTPQAVNPGRKQARRRPDKPLSTGAPSPLPPRNLDPETRDPSTVARHQLPPEEDFHELGSKPLFDELSTAEPPTQAKALPQQRHIPSFDDDEFGLPSIEEVEADIRHKQEEGLKQLASLDSEAREFDSQRTATQRVEVPPRLHNLKPIEGNTVLAASSLKKLYGKKEAVKDISVSILQGEVVGLLGPNGAGKTTSFYMIAGFIAPTRGQILIDEVPITRWPMYKRAHLGIAYLPQEASIFRSLTVEQNILAILEYRKGMSRKERHKMADFLLDELGVTRLRKQRASTLSGGERRRTEIARALALEPRFLLLDEPFAGIDPIAVSEIKGIIRGLAKGNIGILITDHNVRDTLDITDRAYIVNLGEILVNGSREELLSSEAAREIYLGRDFQI